MAEKFQSFIGKWSGSIRCFSSEGNSEVTTPVEVAITQVDNYTLHFQETGPHSRLDIDVKYTATDLSISGENEVIMLNGVVLVPGKEYIFTIYRKDDPGVVIYNWHTFTAPSTRHITSVYQKDGKPFGYNIQQFNKIE